MGSTFLYFAGPEDQKAMDEFIRSLGMHIVPPNPKFEYSDDPTVMAGCWISPVPASELRLPEKPPIMYSDVLDSIISYRRCRYTPPYLQTGDVYWNNDVRELASQTRPTYQKIARWVRKHWTKPEGYDQYYSPEAMQLVFEEGVEATSLLPGMKITRVPVYDDRPIDGERDHPLNS